MAAVLAAVVVAVFVAPTAGAGSRDFTIAPYYVFRADQPYHPEYEAVLREHVRQVRRWYPDKVGLNFHLAQLRVVHSQQGYPTMRCGAFPAPGCVADREQLPYWLRSVLQAVGGLEERTGKWIFAQGGGGFAGANLVGQYEGFALAGDWTLEAFRASSNSRRSPARSQTAGSARSTPTATVLRTAQARTNSGMSLDSTIRTATTGSR